MRSQSGSPRLDRTTFRTSRLLDFLSRKELIAQTGHQPASWPLVVLKELVDNALDACEEAGTAPEITVTLDREGITVADNGPGLPVDTIKGILDFSIRVSNREAYVSPTRGAQGNALKTILAMPFVLDEQKGKVEISTRGSRHEIVCQADRIRQRPVISHDRHTAPDVKRGTTVRVWWPDSACSLLTGTRGRFLQIAEDYTWLNPHLTLTVNIFGETRRLEATDRAWAKWLPSDPTSPHWYKEEHLCRLIAAYLAHKRRQAERTVRELVAEFRGLSATAKQKAVLEATGMSRLSLSALVNGEDLDRKAIGRLLAAMQEQSKPVKPAGLGVLGREHIIRRFEALGCEMATFNYVRKTDVTDGLPWVLETAFGWCEKADRRRLIIGVNWSPGIVNPFRELGTFGQSMDSILEHCRVGREEPVILLVHVARPRVEYSDRGKSAVVVEGDAVEEDVYEG